MLDDPMNPRPSGYPRSYAQAAALLFDRRQQSLRIHDDLTLRFCSGGVGVFHRGVKIIMFPARGRGVRLKAGRGTRGCRRPWASVEAVAAHVDRFLPPGWRAAADRGRLVAWSPDGRCFAGDRLTVRP